MLITPILMTVVFQVAVIGLFFIGMLLDPLAGLWVASLYFLVAGTFFTYKYFDSKLKTK